VDAGEGLDGFQLDQNYVSNNQICTKAFIESSGESKSELAWRELIQPFQKFQFQKFVLVALRGHAERGLGSERNV
jgi:hypothetical protein